MKTLSKSEIRSITRTGLILRSLSLSFMAGITLLIFDRLNYEIMVMMLLITSIIVFWGSQNRSMQKLALKWEYNETWKTFGRKEWWCDNKTEIKKHDQKRSAYMEQLSLTLKFFL